jgi:4,5-DOPA dioxygenase extradiol
VSAHWEAAPLTIGATTAETPLTYDFWGFPQRYYDVTYDAPGAPALATRVEAAMPRGEAVARDPARRLDHGAYVPLTVMYPDATIPVLQVSMPTLDPQRLLDFGMRLRPLREQDVLIIGSGFTTHGLPFLTDPTPDADAPAWSREFDAWAQERFADGDLDGLLDFRAKAPGMPYAHPTIEHFAPLFVALGASDDPEQAPKQVVDGFWMGLAKRSLELV